MAKLIVPKNGKWHARLDVPADLRDIVSKRVLTRTLDTTSKSDAHILKLPVIAEWKQWFVELRHRRESGDWRAQAQEAGLEARENQKEAVLLEHGMAEPASLTPEELTALPTLYEQMAEEGLLREGDALALKNLHLLLLENLRLSTTAEERVRYRRELANLEGYFVVPKAAKEFGLSDELQREALGIIEDPSRYKPRSPFFSKCLAKFREYQTTKKELPAKTVDQQLSRLNTIGKYLAANGYPLDFESFGLFLDSLNLAPKTKGQYIFAGNSFWKWAIKYDRQWKAQYAGKPNPFLEHDLPKTSTSKKKGGYTPFKKEEVEALHSAALGRGDTTLADAIAIAAYTGCRLEEIGRIRPEDISYFDGKPYSFKVTKAKTEAGVRETPIHPDLVPLIERRAANPTDGFLLEGGKNKYGNRLAAVGQRFRTLKTKLGFGPTQVFHSLRKTFTDMLVYAAVDGIVIVYLVGHKVGHITFDKYSTGPNIEQKAEAVKRIKFDLII